jgi:hypothetical protein
MAAKPITPYKRLLDEARDWVFAARYPHTVAMFQFPKAAAQDVSYRLDGLYQRVKAADALGYEVTLEALDGGALHVRYVKRAPTPPHSINPDY